MNDMYKSPIEVIYGEMQMKVENDIYKAVQNVGVNVEKEELLKALAYDRGQYDKGYAKAIDDFAEAIKHEIRNCAWQFSRLEESTIDAIAEKMKGEEHEYDKR